jgi:hypothetical protein
VWSDFPSPGAVDEVNKLEGKSRGKLYYVMREADLRKFEPTREDEFFIIVSDFAKQLVSKYF